MVKSGQLLLFGASSRRDTSCGRISHALIWHLAFSWYALKSLVFNEECAMKKLAISLIVLFAGSLLCTACGLKNDLYLPDEGQAMQVTQPASQNA